MTSKVASMGRKASRGERKRRRPLAEPVDPGRPVWLGGRGPQAEVGVQDRVQRAGVFLGLSDFRNLINFNLIATLTDHSFAICMGE